MLCDARGFNWLLAELDREEDLGYGWACLNDLQNAEWGYVRIPEIEVLGAEADEGWTPMRFKEAKALVLGYMEKPGTNQHYDWWRHEYRARLEREYERQGMEATGYDFMEFADNVYIAAFPYFR